MPTDSLLATPFTRDAGVAVPLICGAMYPCSNPELVGAASAAGAIGIVQPVSLTFVHKHDYREGLRTIKRLAGGRPIGLNVLVEKSAKAYEDRLRRWTDIALEEGVRFFVTALGNPAWVVEKAHAAGGVVYHDVTERKWAQKAIDLGVDGLICVNARAGGHAGRLSPETLLDACGDLGKPLVCAGGVGDEAGFVAMLRLGYSAVQMGTRFIATTECSAHADYKAAILRAHADDVVLTERLSGVPCAVIKTPYIERVGTTAGPVARWLLRHRRTKHWMRTWYALRSGMQLKKANAEGLSYRDFFQAGKSVDGIDAVEPVAAIVDRCRDAALAAAAPAVRTA